MRVLSPSIVLAACLGAACGRAQPAAPPVRSVVLIGVDTLRADHLGLYGAERPTSPVLDRLAGRARVFERAYATSSWTLPSFASLLTGLAADAHGAGLLLRQEPAAEALQERATVKRRTKLDPAVTTLAERLSAAGLATLAVVQTPNLDPAYGVQRGFEVYDNSLRGRKRLASQAVDRALGLVDDQAGRPFFLFLHLIDPHLSYDAPAPVGGTFTDGIDCGLKRPVRNYLELRRNYPSYTPDQKRFVSAAYDEEIAYLDRELGRLLDGLRERGLTDTLFLLTSDHGEEFFEHGAFEHGHSLYQEVLHVPLLVWGPGVAPGREPAPVSIADVTPTVLDAVGLPWSGGTLGRSLWPLLTGSGPAPSDRLIVASGTLYGPAQRMALRWPYKLIQRPATGAVELYDLERDPREQNDLSASRPDLVEALTAALSSRRGGPGAPGEEAVLNDDTLDDLRDLGYAR